MSAAYFRGDLVLAVSMETNGPTYGALLWPDTGKFLMLEDVPQLALASKDYLAVTRDGSAVTVYDGKSLHSVKIGRSARGLFFEDPQTSIATASSEDRIVRIELPSRRIIESHQSPWPRPSGIASWRGHILIAAEGTRERPQGALIRWKGDDLASLPLGRWHAADIVVSGDTAFVTAVDESKLVVVDLQRWRVVTEISIAEYPSSPVMVDRM